MIGGLPETTARGIAEMIVHTLEAVTALSLLCIVLAAVFARLAYRSTARRRVVWTWLAVAAGVSALVPLALVVYALNP